MIDLHYKSIASFSHIVRSKIPTSDVSREPVAKNKQNQERRNNRLLANDFLSDVTQSHSNKSKTKIST